MTLFEAAADAGNSLAVFLLAIAYMHGNDARQSAADAERGFFFQLARSMPTANAAVAAPDPSIGFVGAGRVCGHVCGHVYGHA